MIKSFSIDWFLVGHARTPSLEGVRALAVLMVFNVHALAGLIEDPLFQQSSLIISFIVKSLQAGHFGVDLFFVLSGYLIFRAIPKATSIRSFMAKRYLRLWPVVLVTTLPEVVGREIWRIFDNLSLLMIWTSRPENFVMWSLTYEIYFYFLIAVWGIYLAKIGFVQALPQKGIFIWGALIVLAFFFIPGHFIKEPYRFVGFFWGIWLAINEKRIVTSENRFLSTAGAPVAILLLVALQVWYGVFELRSPLEEQWKQPVYFLVAQPAFTLLIGSLLIPGSRLNSFFSSRRMRAIGNISYSFYVIHWLWGIKLADQIYADVADIWVKYIGIYTLGMAFSLVFSALLFLWLEKPYFSGRGYFPFNRRVASLS